MTQSKLARIVKTFTFRLALVYVGLFSLSVISLFTFIYTFEMNYLDRQNADAIRTHYSYLRDEYRQNGSSAVEAQIKELIAEDDDGNEIYLLVNREYEKLAGNLNEWPIGAAKESAFEKEGYWVRFRINGAQKSIEVKAVMIPLSKWRFLLVGQTLQGNERIEQTIVQTFWASLLLTLFMAFIGALVMTRSVMRRINVINRSAHAIMHGDMAARIPFTRGGDEFDELSANLNEMLDKIATLLQSISEFANNIAHDLRGPLNRIINRLEGALRGIDADNPALALLEKNILDMQELVGTFNSILKISELEAESEAHSFEPCDLGEILANLVELYEPYALEKQIALRFEPQADCQVPGEKNLLTQAFANLLDNALKFTPKGGTITLACEAREGRVEITISDNGPGIPSEYRDRVFEKFFRLEQSRHTKGNGLGLSLVAAIAQLHRAGITLEDNQPGLRVILSFPQSMS